MSDDLGSRVKQALSQCVGFDGDEVSTARAQAMDYYFQRERGDEVDGRSAVVSGDVSAMTEAVLAQMADSFSSDRLVDFDPIDDDETQAQLESDAVQWFVMDRQKGFIKLLSAIKNGLLHRNPVMRIDMEDSIRHRPKYYSGVQPEAVEELIEQNNNVVRHDYDESTGELVVTIEEKLRQLRVANVSLENFVYDAEWTEHTLEGIPICAERHVSTRAEMVSLGMDKETVDTLPLFSNNKNAEQTARDPKGMQKAEKGVDTSQERVEWYDVFIRMESSDGIDELRRIALCYTSGTILWDKPAPFVIFASGTALLNPGRFTGVSLFDKLKQTQDERTALKRALNDNVTATTKNRLAAMDGVVNLDDTTKGRPNHTVRVKDTVQDVRQAVMPLAVPDTSGNILANLESTARARTEMGGAALDMQTAQMQIGGDRMGSEGLDRAYSVAEQLSALMIKTIAETFLADVFLLAHRTLREYFDEPVPIKRHGKWESVKPSEWPERYGVTVKPGMSPGERQRKIQALDYVIQSNMELAQNGMEGVMTDLSSFNRALLDRCRLAEVQNPEQYYVDPESQQAQAALKQKQEAAQRSDMERKALMQTAHGMEQLRIAFQKYAHDTELQFKYFGEILGAEIEEAKIVGKTASELITQSRSASSGNEGAGEGAEETTSGEQVTS